MVRSTNQSDLPAPPETDADPPRLGAVVSECEDGPDQCTVFPASVSNRDERRSAWITAEGDAFADAETFR